MWSRQYREQCTLAWSDSDAASILEPGSQSPHIPAHPKGSKMQGTPGVLDGRAAPLKISE